jgi:hypothetical protein
MPTIFAIDYEALRRLHPSKKASAIDVIQKGILLALAHSCSSCRY